MPRRTINNESGKLFVDRGTRSTAICMKIEMTAIFAIVPKPGRSFNGHHKSKTVKPMTKVHSPIDRGVWCDSPWAKTDHGAFPICD
jgi:hypothetical protein